MRGLQSPLSSGPSLCWVEPEASSGGVPPAPLASTLGPGGAEAPSRHGPRYLRRLRPGPVDQQVGPSQ